ncbi:MAG: hypothetical protein ACRBN8_05355 [Nannocystales bacterium]
MSRQLRRRTLATLGLSGVAGLLMLPLAQTDWAETTRQESARHDDTKQTEPEAERRPAALGPLMLVLPFVKVAVLMGVPAALVLGVGAVVGRSRNS